ncbi:MAG: PEP/pyruvate-binding domain-containing protein [Spirochaetales bacterium]|nr:PEP/pyruvate-binding domain-containing protein [Spirochaetales bacterium]
MARVFSQMSTGLPELDKVFQGVRPGDNIVFQIDSVDDYVPFVHPFCHEAKEEKRELIYFRFADHPELLPKDVDAHTYHLEPNEGFENFISSIFDVIEKFGEGACYVFDCLSDLAADWYSDRMLGNFFMLTCPYLYDFETATYFALFRDHHMAVATNAIHNTAQVVVDVYKKNGDYYLHPLKVYKRHSPTMYMLHHWKNKSFTPVTESMVIAGIMTSVPQPWLDFTLQEYDTWTKTFYRAWEITSRDPEKKFENSAKAQNLKIQLLRMAFTRDERLNELAQKYLSLSNLVAIGKRMIGTGLIGGKSAGMLLARAILVHEDQSWEQILEAHDSFFIGSDVFYSYLIQNGCWWLRRKLIKGEIPLNSTENVRNKMLHGAFPEEVMSQFEEMLEYFGQSPIIVRSSSLLEDAYGNAFSGKYESVFCANQGTPKERMEAFMNAVRTVYASTLTYEALAYRAHRGLLESDEQMALLVQRVSGTKHDNLYFPELAGVGFSYNPYVWNREIDPGAGLLRLVFGLGTRAVDRCDDDYTRVVSLSAPTRRPVAELAEMGRYSQHRVDLLDLEQNAYISGNFKDIAGAALNIHLDLVATVDREVQQRARERNMKNVFPYILTFEKLLTHTPFVENMKSLLSTLQKAYEYPVDVEFTANFYDGNNFCINLLQCRPFQVKGEVAAVKAPENLKPEDIIIKTAGPIIGTSCAVEIDLLVYVVPEKYSGLPLSECYSVARLIGQINHLPHEDNKNPPTIALVGPGRWGTTTPALGVPVSFSEINSVKILCEVAKMHSGLIPDVSLGTHFFNDLVETDILYCAVHPDREDYIYSEEYLNSAPNALVKLIPEAEAVQEIIRVIDYRTVKNGKKLYLSANTVDQEGIFYLK